MKYAQGFSTAELLITLFIGVAFITTAYQLYGIVIDDGGTSRMQAAASDLAYQTLRQSASNQSIIKPTCVTNSATTTPTNPGLSTPFNVKTTVSCPYGTTSSISLVTVQVNYGSEQVTHAIYTTQN